MKIIKKNNFIIQINIIVGKVRYKKSIIKKIPIYKLIVH